MGDSKPVDVWVCGVGVQGCRVVYGFRNARLMGATGRHAEVSRRQWVRGLGVGVGWKR